MSFNFAQLFDELSCAIFRSGQSLFIVSIENAFMRDKPLSGYPS